MGQNTADGRPSAEAQELTNGALQGITRRIQGPDNILSYRFSGSTSPELVRNVEKVLLRVDAQFEIDLQRECSCAAPEVNILEFAGIAGIDPVTGRETLNVGKATPNESSWTVLWADQQQLTGVTPLDVIVHEWGHVLGLVDADSKDPLRTDTTSADTVMSYNRLNDTPAGYYRALDVEALTWLWGPETSAAAQRNPFVETTSKKPASSFAWDVQNLINAAENNADFLNAAYSVILERAIDPDGAGWWTAQLEQGLSRRELVDTLLLSDEFLQILLDA